MIVIRKIKQLLKPGDTLSQRAARGGIWITATRAIGEGLRLARVIILARMLSPDDFGMLGIALLALSALRSFTETGLTSALIQKKGNVNAYLNTAWTINGLRGTATCVILVMVAPYVAGFFNEPAATNIVRVIALSTLIQGWSNIGRIFFDKELDFGKKFIYEAGGTVVDFVVAISAALILRNVWALVFGSLAGQLVRFILSYLLHSYRPRLYLDLAKGRELFGFGKWLFISSITTFLRSHGDDTFLGWLLGAATLGLYQMAYRISTWPTTMITSVVSQVAFPTYSKLQDNPERLKTAYLRSLQLTVAVAAPIVGGIFLMAPDFTRLFLTEKWMPMVSTLQVLSIWGLILSIAAPTGPLWLAIGKPHLPTYFHIAKLVLLAALIYPFTMWWGMLGTAIAVAVESAVVDIFTFPVMLRTIKCSAWTLFRQILFPFAATAVMVGILAFLRSRLPQGAGMPYFFMIVALGVFIYVACIWLLERFANYGLVASVRQVLRAAFSGKGMEV